MKKKLSQLELVVLGLLLGVLAQGLYDSMKLFVTPMVEGRTITSLEMRKSIMAVGIALLLILLLFGVSKVILSKRED